LVCVAAVEVAIYDSGHDAAIIVDTHVAQRYFARILDGKSVGHNCVRVDDRCAHTLVKGHRGPAWLIDKNARDVFTYIEINRGLAGDRIDGRAAVWIGAVDAGDVPILLAAFDNSVGAGRNIGEYLAAAGRIDGELAERGVEGPRRIGCTVDLLD